MASQYPNVRLVYGDLDSTDLIVEEAKNADIAYRKPPNVTGTAVTADVLQTSRIVTTKLQLKQFQEVCRSVLPRHTGSTPPGR